jgi:uncharacterized membrane protein YgdD (TMEM256/DUF423 family)
MSNYSSKNVLFSSDKEYFYIEKIRNNEQINFNRTLWHNCDNIGAFGAHALKKVLLRTTNYFETGYAIKCTMLCFNPYCTVNDLSEKQRKLSIFIVLVILFSLSIYLLATNLTSFDFNNFCNSIGGLLLIVAWGVLFFNF